MSASADMIRVAILALLAGVALPLLVQLFLAARAFRRTVNTVEQRLDRALRDIDDLAADVRRRPASSPASLVAAAAAAAPAVVAAVRAFRTSMQVERAEAPQEAPANHHDKEMRP